MLYPIIDINYRGWCCLKINVGISPGTIFKHSHGSEKFIFIKEHIYNMGKTMRDVKVGIETISKFCGRYTNKIQLNVLLE